MSAVTNPWLLFAGGGLVFGFLAAALVGPFLNHYGSVQKTALWIFAVMVFLAMVVSFIGVLVI